MIRPASHCAKGSSCCAAFLYHSRASRALRGVARPVSNRYPSTTCAGAKPSSAERWKYSIAFKSLRVTLLPIKAFIPFSKSWGASRPVVTVCPSAAMQPRRKQITQSVRARMGTLLDQSEASLDTSMVIAHGRRVNIHKTMVLRNSEQKNNERTVKEKETTIARSAPESPALPPPDRPPP